MTCEPAKSLVSAKTAPCVAPTATCPACEKASANPLSGMYHFKCLHCCARLVLSAHPDKRQASAMLGAILRFRESPSRADVLECVRQHLTKPPSALKKSESD